MLNPLVSFVDSKLLKLLVRLPDDPIKLEKKKNTRYLISVLISYLFVIAAILAILYGFAVMLIGRISFTNVPNMLQDLMGTAIKYEATLQTWIQHNIPPVSYTHRRKAICSTNATAAALPLEGTK